MKFEEFKEELNKQINLNYKFFKPEEVLLLFDFKETIDKKDFLD